MTSAARLIAERFKEAADVERRLPRVSGPRTGSWWPEYDYDSTERAGWTQAEQDEAKARWAARRDITAGELSRYNEVVEWTIDHIPAASMRKLVWTWALCQVIPGWSFVTACNRHGWARSTAYSRLERLWADLAIVFANERVLLRAPLGYTDGHETPLTACSGHRLAQLNPSAAAVPNKPYRTEPSADLPEVRSFEWAQRQAEIEAKRRRKLGLEDAA
jgi:hypothetical protein